LIESAVLGRHIRCISWGFAKLELPERSAETQKSNKGKKKKGLQNSKKAGPETPEETVKIHF
jgi:hypothetical protein